VSANDLSGTQEDVCAPQRCRGQDQDSEGLGHSHSDGKGEDGRADREEDRAENQRDPPGGAGGPSNIGFVGPRIDQVELRIEMVETVHWGFRTTSSCSMGSCWLEGVLSRCAGFDANGIRVAHRPAFVFVDDSKFNENGLFFSGLDAAESIGVFRHWYALAARGSAGEIGPQMERIVTPGSACNSWVSRFPVGLNRPVRAGA